MEQKGIMEDYVPFSYRGVCPYNFAEYNLAEQKILSDVYSP